MLINNDYETDTILTVLNNGLTGLIKMPVFINSYPTFGFFDTGSTTTLVDDRLIDPSNIHPLKKQLTITGIGNDMIQVIGRALRICLRIQNQSTLMEVNVIKYFNFPLLIGNDYLHNLGIILNYEQKYWRWKELILHITYCDVTVQDLT